MAKDGKKAPEDRKAEAKFSVKNSESHKSKYFFHDHFVYSEYYRTMTDLDKTMIMHSLKGKIQLLRDLLSDPKAKLSKKERYRKELLLWRYVGFTEHKINYSMLTKVSQTYERIGLVPQGYMYADLYAH